MGLRTKKGVDGKMGSHVSPGDDVIVMWDGIECRGEVVSIHNGWIQAKIIIDPLAHSDPYFSPVSYVMVRDKWVSKLVDQQQHSTTEDPHSHVIALSLDESVQNKEGESAESTEDLQSTGMLRADP